MALIVIVSYIVLFSFLDKDLFKEPQIYYLITFFLNWFNYIKTIKQCICPPIIIFIYYSNYTRLSEQNT